MSGELLPTPTCSAATALQGVQNSWEPLQSAGRAEVPLLSPGHCQPKPGICTEVPADLPLSLKGSFSFCCCLGSVLSGASAFLLSLSLAMMDSVLGGSLPSEIILINTSRAGGTAWEDKLCY